MIDRSPAFNRIVRGWGTNHIVALYALFGAAWILLSDRLIIFNAPDPAAAALFSTLKGLSYVAVTATLLHWLINRHTAELREKEERYRTLSETISDYAYSFRFEPDGRTVYEWVTPSFVSFHGYTLEEIAARGGAQTLVYPDDAEIARDHIRTLLAGQSDSREYRVVRKDGEVRWVRNYARPIWDEQATRVVRLYGSTQDITDRKRTQEALRESEEQFRSLVEQFPLSVQGLSPDGRTVQVNHAFETLWGLRLDDLENYNILADQQLVRLGLMPYIQRGFSGEAASIPAAAYDSRESVGTGEKKWVQARIYPVKDKAGNIRQVILIHEDITERKQAEEALRESEERFRIIFEHANDAIHIDNADDEILDVNPRMCELMGYSRGELLTMRIPDLQAPEVRASDRVIVSELARHGEGLFESLNLHRSGRRIPVEISVARVARSQGDLFVSVIRDITDRKRAEDALRAREALLRAVVDNVPFEFWARDLEGRCFMENAALVRHWGSQLGTRVEDSAAAAADVALWQANNARALAGEMVDEEVSFVVHGDRRQFRNIIASIRVGDEIRGILGLNIDITDRKRAEEELRQSQAFNQALIDYSPLGISVRNRTGKLLFANAAWRAIWAISDSDLRDDTTRERDTLQFNTRDDYLKPHQADLRRVYEQGGYLHLPELQTTHPRPGAAEWVSQHFYAIMDGHSQVDRMVILTEDISDRKRRERELGAIAAIALALRAASTRAEMLPIILQQTAALLKSDGAALILNEPATGENVIVHGLGISSDLIGLRIPAGAGIIGHVMTTGQPYLTQDAERDPYVFRPDLVNELHAIGCAPLIALDRILGALWIGRTTTITGAEVRVLAAISDIAANALHRAEVLETLEQRVYDRTRELAEANERLTELDRLKSKFVSDVSHELRTPITSLMLNVELLEHGKPEKREHYLNVIRQQTARQVQLIEDILNLSRLELSTASAQFAPVKVNALVEQAVNVYHSSAEAANLRLNFTPDPGQPIVLGVESHLSQVVTNLIANAINYTPAGSVEVTTRLDGREVIIEVRDTGLGIAPEDMPHLFDRFYRGKLTWQVRGSGLGLAIVKEITEVHKGRVEVDSQAGVGSTFRVYLPVV